MIDGRVLELIPKSDEVLDIEFPVIDESKITGYRPNTLYLTKEVRNVLNGVITERTIKTGLYTNLLIMRWRNL